MKLDRRHFLLSSAAASQAAFSQTEQHCIPTAMIGTTTGDRSYSRAFEQFFEPKVAALC